MAKCGAAIVFLGVFRQVSPTQVLLFGGGNELGDSWMLNNSSTGLDWSGPFSPTIKPDGRGDHNMADDPVSNRVILYGGNNVHNAHPFDDTWNGLCGNSPSWGKATPAHNPGRRTSMGMATGPDGMTVVMFGGLKENSVGELHENGETWTWGRRAACLPTDGSAIRVGTEVNCQFDAVEGSQFGGWTASGFASPSGYALKATFHTESPGEASITAEWTDEEGSHTQTYNYTIVRPIDLR
jgi:hypothetical protein